MDIASVVKREKNLSRLYAFIGLLLIIFYLLTELVFDFWYRVAANYGLFLIIAFIAISFFLRFFNSSKEEKCLVLYAIWVLVTRMLNGDVFLDKEFYFLVRMVLFTECFICIGFALDSEDRKSFFNLVCAVVCGYWLFLAVVGLYATIRLTRIALPPAETTIGLIFWGGNYQMGLDNIHRNISGVWFALATLLMLYQFFNSRRVFWKIPTAVAAVIFYFATAMSFCRAAQVGLSVALAMLAALLVLERFSNKSAKIKTAAVLAAVIVCLPLSYAGYGGATSLCSTISAHVVAAEEEAAPVEAGTASDETSAAEEPAVDEKAEDTELVFTESRGADNMMMLGGRSYLWKAGIIVLGEEPERLVKGGKLEGYMDRVVEVCTVLANRTVPDVNSQMHNYLLDSLLLTGLPGALILIIFTVFLLIRMIKVFFSRDAAVPFQLKLMVLPIAMLLVDNMMEAHIFRIALAQCLLFFFITGVFLAWSYEVLPSTGKRK